jgi:hypothetical protein
VKKFNVYYGDTIRATVEAERVFVNTDGRLSFYNVSVRADVAGFNSGAWSYYSEVKDA